MPILELRQLAAEGRGFERPALRARASRCRRWVASSTSLTSAAKGEKADPLRPCELPEGFRTGGGVIAVVGSEGDQEQEGAGCKL